jgi:hypothetical protein
MGLSNAERQRRYITRLKAAAHRTDSKHVICTTHADEKPCATAKGRDIAELLRALAARPDRCEKIAEILETADYEAKPAYPLWDDLGNVGVAVIVDADGDEDLIHMSGDIADVTENVDARERFASMCDPRNKPHWK